jgi:carbonic anhydrase
MSCSPADLTENITNSCDLKCKLITDYPSQGITVTGISTGDSTALTINGFSNLNIEFNFSEYVVNNIRFVKKSYHRYGGKSVSAEMIITHFGRGGFILICIPIVVGFSSSDLDDVFSNADKGNESSFDLNKFIPQQPYYSYKGGSGPPGRCPGNQAGEVIVFQKRHALTLLQENIDFIADSRQQVRFNISDGESISFSKNKPLKKEYDTAFPITCEPYEDTEMEEVKKRKFRSPFVMSDKDFKEWGSNVAVQIILGAVILYVLVKFLFFITNIGFKGAARRGSGFDSTMKTMIGTDIALGAANIMTR